MPLWIGNTTQLQLHLIAHILAHDHAAVAMYGCQVNPVLFFTIACRGAVMRCGVEDCAGSQCLHTASGTVGTEPLHNSFTCTGRPIQILLKDVGCGTAALETRISEICAASLCSCCASKGSGRRTNTSQCAVHAKVHEEAYHEAAASANTLRQAAAQHACEQAQLLCIGKTGPPALLCSSNCIHRRLQTVGII